jgi:glycosyltransferase involved in cell wall biosynthesis
MARPESVPLKNDVGVRPLRLLVIAHSLEHGGAEHSLRVLLEHLDRGAFDCLLAAPDGPMRELYLGRCRLVVTLRRGFLPLTFHILAYLRGFYVTVVNTVTLCRYLRREPVDVVLTNTGVALHGPLAAAICGIPSVTMMREIVSPSIVRSAVSRLLLWLNRRVIVNSRAIVSAIGGTVSEKLLVVHGGVERDGNRSVQAAGVIPALPSGGPVIGHIGTVHPIKGHVAFLKMAAVVARRIPEARFVIAGRYDARSRYYRGLVRLRRRLALDERVVFTGFVDPIAPLVERLAVLVITSTTESLPRVALEAMAAGRPVAAFDIGGVSDLVLDGATGRLIRFGDVEAMAEAVCQLIAEPAEAARLGAGGRARVERSFQLAPYVSQVESVLREVAGQGNGTRKEPDEMGAVRS